MERDELLADIIIGAIEGGTGYWAAVVSYKHADLPAAEVYAIIYEDDDVAETKIAALAASLGRKPTAQEAIDAGFAYRIDVDTVARGLSIVVDVRGEFKVNEEIRTACQLADTEVDATHIDADCADAIVQAALFGELVYG